MKDGWMSKLIINSIEDVDVSDFEKLLDCSFLTKSISKSIQNLAILCLPSSVARLGDFKSFWS